MSEQDLSFRSNPFSQPNTVANAYIDKSYVTVPVAVTYTNNAGATSMALTATLPANNTLSYLRMTVTDGKGAEAVGQFDVANIAGGAAVNTTALDANTDWLCQLAWAEPTTAQESPKFDSIDFTLTGAKGSATNTYNTTQVAGTLALYAEVLVNGVVTVAKALVADAGTLAAGNIAQGATAIVKVYYANTATGNNPLKVLLAADNGADVAVNSAFGYAPYYPALVAPEGESVAAQFATIETAVFGAILASTITVTSNDPANPSYVITITATIV